MDSSSQWRRNRMETLGMLKSVTSFPKHATVEKLRTPLLKKKRRRTDRNDCTALLQMGF
jgi:hypothetical protein